MGETDRLAVGFMMGFTHPTRSRLDAFLGNGVLTPMGLRRPPWKVTFSPFVGWASARHQRDDFGGLKPTLRFYAMGDPHGSHQREHDLGRVGTVGPGDGCGLVGQHAGQPADRDGQIPPGP